MTKKYNFWVIDELLAEPYDTGRLRKEIGNREDPIRGCTPLMRSLRNLYFYKIYYNMSRNPK